MITNELVDRACEEVDAYTEDRMMEEFDAFFKEQPSICEFIMEVTDDSSVQIQEFALFLSFMIFKTVKISNSDKLDQVSSERVESAYRESEMWVDRISQQESLNDAPKDSEPHLIQYVISELNHPLEDGTLLEDEQKGEVFFVLKTVISSLTRSPLGKETD